MSTHNLVFKNFVKITMSGRISVGYVLCLKKIDDIHINIGTNT